jgi:hypothetical protein
MDQLTVIAVVMSAILFTWVGYFIGNFFPIFGKKQTGTRVERSSAERKFANTALRKLTSLFSSDRDDEALEQEPDSLEVSDGLSLGEKAPTEKLKALTHIWYDRSERKIFAEFGGGGIDLDERLTSEQHSHLSFLLLDLQDKVGISATLRAVIEEREGDAIPEEEDEKPVRQSFNPLRSFLNYVQADVPKLEETGDSIPLQINEILQKKLKGTAFENQGISISEWPDRGVVFIVGVDVYSDIHEIPDSDIRYIIREAVKEWESRENSD